MEFTKRKSVRKLITNGCCFLCLKSEDSQEDDEVMIVGDVRKSVLLRSLLRYLQIGENLRNQSTSCGLSLNGDDLEAELCQLCEENVTRFSDMFQQWEKIQGEMNWYLERIHETISGSGKDAGLVKNYSRKMSSDPEALAQHGFVDCLRKELANKSQNNQQSTCKTLSDMSKLPQNDTVSVKEKGSDDDIEVIELEDNNDIEIVEKSKPFGNCQVFFDYSESLPRSPPLPLSPIRPASSEQEVEEDFSSNNAGDNEPRQKSGSPSSAETSASEVNSPSDEISIAATTSQGNAFPKDPLGLFARKRKILLNVIYTRNFVNGMLHCTKCDQTSRHPSVMQRHYNIVHQKKRIQCDICKKAVFTRKDSLDRHKISCRQRTVKKPKPTEKVKEVVEEVEIYCNLCMKPFPNKKSLYAHRIVVHRKVTCFACNVCDKKFQQKEDLKSHRSQHI